MPVKQNEMEIKSRKVTVHQFELINIELPFVDFMVHCTKEPTLDR